MKIQIKKRELLEALKVSNLTSSASGTDLSTHILFRIQESGLELLAYTRKIFSSVKVSEFLILSSLSKDCLALSKLSIKFNDSLANENPP